MAAMLKVDELDPQERTSVNQKDIPEASRIQRESIFRMCPEEQLGKLERPTPAGLHWRFQDRTGRCSLPGKMTKDFREPVVIPPVTQEIY